MPTNPRPGHADPRQAARSTAARPARGARARQRARRRRASRSGALARAAARALRDRDLRLRARARRRAPCEPTLRALARRAAERRALRRRRQLYALDPAARARLRRRGRGRSARRATASAGCSRCGRLGFRPGWARYQNPAERLTARLGARAVLDPGDQGRRVRAWASEAARLPGARACTMRSSAPRTGAARRRALPARDQPRAGGLEGAASTTGRAAGRARGDEADPRTLRQGARTVDARDAPARSQATYQRSDVTSVPAASVVGRRVVGARSSRRRLPGEIRRGFAGRGQRPPGHPGDGAPRRGVRMGGRFSPEP